jgi:hypothetical protein
MKVPFVVSMRLSVAHRLGSEPATAGGDSHVWLWLQLSKYFRRLGGLANLRQPVPELARPALVEAPKLKMTTPNLTRR